MRTRPKQPCKMMLAAPLTAVVFVAMAGYSLASMRFVGNEAYLLEVKVAIEALPERIGAFRGTDRPVQEAAQQLLRPNKLLQREYIHDFTGETFSLLIVHCADVRDMMGHFPPNCYPSSGWDMDGKSEEEIERSKGGPIPITRYRVSRDDGSVEYARVIANTFVVPRADDPLGRDDRILDNVTRSRWSSGLGAAQVQIITDAKMDPATRAEIERSVADRLEGLIGAISKVREGEEEDP